MITPALEISRDRPGTPDKPARGHRRTQLQARFFIAVPLAIELYSSRSTSIAEIASPDPGRATRPGSARATRPLCPPGPVPPRPAGPLTGPGHGQAARPRKPDSGHTGTVSLTIRMCRPAGTP